MRYAGFGPRAWAAVLDALVLWALSCAYWLAASVPWGMARHLAVPYVCAPALYNMVCLAAWGQTLGKRWAHIRVVTTGGEPIGPRHAALRHAVDALLAVPMSFAWAAALQAVGPGELAATPFSQRPALVRAAGPEWQHWLVGAAYVWSLSELVVLLLNARRRALHDYLAGTVVVVVRPRAPAGQV